MSKEAEDSMDEKKWKRKMRYRKIRNAITAHVPRLILWGITLGSLAEMLFCVWACIEKYRPQAAAAAGLGLVSFIAGGAALAACRAPSTKIREKDAVVVENGSFVFGGNAFLAAASTALSILTVYLALEEVWGGIAVMGSMEILGKLCALFYLVSCWNQRIILWPDGTLLYSSVTGRERRIRVSQIGKLEMSISSRRDDDIFTIRVIDREGKKRFTFDNTMENYDILYEKMEEFSVPIEGRTWTKRGITLEELYERKCLYSRDTKEAAEQQHIDTLKKLVWVLTALLVLCCGIFHFVLPIWIPRKYCLFLASLLPLCSYLLGFRFPQIIVTDTLRRTDETWERTHVVLPLYFFLLILINGIGVVYFILADYYIADVGKLVFFCIVLSLVFIIPAILRIPPLLRNPDHVFTTGAIAAFLGIGLALSITLLSMGKGAAYPARIADTRTKEAESRTIYYVDVVLEDGKTVEIDAPIRIYTLAAGGFPLTLKEWEGVFGIRFFNLYEEE